MNYISIINKASLFILLLFIGTQCYGQEREPLDTVKSESPINFYTQLSVGLTSPLYRDFATSPLFYRGLGINLSTAWQKRSDKRERIFKAAFGFSALVPRVPESDFIQPGGMAFYGRVDLFYQQLWKLEALSNEKNNLKIGGAVNITQNIRANPALLNNTMGLENISNVMASAQWTLDISRTKPKTLNLWLFKPTLKPVKRELRFMANVGVLNFNFRPGYAYAYDSEMNGIETNPVSWAFSNYKFSMNGWRVQTQLEFIKYLPNGNARSWSYVWEAANAKGRHEPFQMASHRIQFTLYFNTKTR